MLASRILIVASIFVAEVANGSSLYGGPYKYGMLDDDIRVNPEIVDGNFCAHNEAAVSEFEFYDKEAKMFCHCEHTKKVCSPPHETIRKITLVV